MECKDTKICLGFKQRHGTNVSPECPIPEICRIFKVLENENEQLNNKTFNDTWRHKVQIYDPENALGFSGHLEAKVWVTGYLDHGVLLELEEPVVLKKHYDVLKTENESLKIDLETLSSNAMAAMELKDKKIKELEDEIETLYEHAAGESL